MRPNGQINRCSSCKPVDLDKKALTTHQITAYKDAGDAPQAWPESSYWIKVLPKCIHGKAQILSTTAGSMNTLKIQPYHRMSGFMWTTKTMDKHTIAAWTLVSTECKSHLICCAWQKVLHQHPHFLGRCIHRVAEVAEECKLFMRLLLSADDVQLRDVSDAGIQRVP